MKSYDDSIRKSIAKSNYGKIKLRRRDKGSELSRIHADKIIRIDARNLGTVSYIIIHSLKMNEGEGTARDRDYNILSVK